MNFLVVPACLEVIDLRGVRNGMHSGQIHQDDHRR